MNEFWKAPDQDSAAQPSAEKSESAGPSSDHPSASDPPVVEPPVAAPDTPGPGQPAPSFAGTGEQGDDAGSVHGTLENEGSKRKRLLLFTAGAGLVIVLLAVLAAGSKHHTTGQTAAQPVTPRTISTPAQPPQSTTGPSGPTGTSPTPTPTPTPTPAPTPTPTPTPSTPTTPAHPLVPVLATPAEKQAAQQLMTAALNQIQGEIREHDTKPNIYAFAADVSADLSNQLHKRVPVIVATNPQVGQISLSSARSLGWLLVRTRVSKLSAIEIFKRVSIAQLPTLEQNVAYDRYPGT